MQRAWRRVPLLLFTLFLVGLNGIMFWCMDWLADLGMYRWLEWFSPIMVGSVFGQGCYVALLGGLVGRSWLDGFLLALSLTITSFVIAMLVAYISLEQPVENAFIMVTLLPTYVLAGITPLLACRQWLGWRLTLQHEPTRPRESNSTEDWLGAMAVTATTMMMARVPQLYWEMNTTQYWVGVSIGWAVIVVVSAIALLPATYFAFRVHNRMLGWLGLIGLGRKHH